MCRSFLTFWGKAVVAEGSGLELSLFELFFFDYGQAVRSRIPGGIHHGTSRGNARLPIFKDDQNRHRFWAIFQEVVERFKAFCFSISNIWM
jgi:hypothetical protein